MALSSPEAAYDLESEIRRRTVQGRAFGRSVAPTRSDVSVAPPQPLATKAKGVSIVTVTQTTQPFKLILEKSPDDNLRMMYDEVCAEVQRRGIKL